MKCLFINTYVYASLQYIMKTNSLFTAAVTHDSDRFHSSSFCYHGLCSTEQLLAETAVITEGAPVFFDSF